MRLFYTLVFFFSASAFIAQTQITSADLPQANDVLVTRGATLLQDVDYAATGPNHTWTYGLDILQPAATTTSVNCVDISTTPLTYQFLFNNPFDPTHNSDFAQGVDAFSAGTFTFEDVYAYFQNNSTKYAQTGLGATVNSIPVPAQGNPVDVIYNLPIDYGDSDTGNSHLEISIPTIGGYFTSQTRSNFCDGWGTLIIYGQTFPVLHMVTTIDAVDSIYVDFIGSGINIPRPQSIEYKWLCPAFNVPLLQITTSAGVVTNVATADIYTGINEKAAFDWSVYPNPSADYITISCPFNAAASYMLFDMNGQLVRKEKLHHAQVNISELPSGEYLLVLETPLGTSSRILVKQ